MTRRRGGSWSDECTPSRHCNGDASRREGGKGGEVARIRRRGEGEGVLGGGG